MPFGVGRYCFIHSKGNARASYKDKANSVPTSFFIYGLPQGTSEHINYYYEMSSMWK